jgi:hypothetical protein
MIKMEEKITKTTIKNNKTSKTIKINKTSMNKIIVNNPNNSNNKQSKVYITTNKC